MISFWDKFKKEDKDDKSGLFIPAGLFVWMGFGFFFDQLVGWLFIGLGVGFIVMAIFKNKDKFK